MPQPRDAASASAGSASRSSAAYRVEPKFFAAVRPIRDEIENRVRGLLADLGLTPRVM
ncbi:hypothetical protein ACFCY0_34120 [Streptomyces chartreusis]|uniref:hypothetical protein n=1 Tax=Streptomyces chartreusis TaxID=1969 RepID=UPI0035E01983